MMSICLIALIGLPAAGKTSFCKSLLVKQQQQKQKETNFNIIHLCYDKLLNVQSYLSDYKEQRNLIINLLTNLVVAYKTRKELPVETLQQHQIAYVLNKDNNGLLVICDDNHYYRSMRYKLYQICREQQIHYGQIYFKCNLQETLRRNAIRHLDAAADVVPEEVVHNMYKRLEPPPSADAAAGNSWESNTLILEHHDLKQICLKEILSFLIKSFKMTPPLPLVVDEKQLQPNSDVHNLDILLRKRIKELLITDKEMIDKEVKSKRFLNLNLKRKEILAMFKASNEKTEENNLNSYVELLK